MSKLGMAFYIAFCSLDGLVGGYPLDIIVEARTGSLVSVDGVILGEWLTAADGPSWSDGQCPF